ncbi:MAG: DinB family protein [Phycisphaerae bacterium]
MARTRSNAESVLLLRILDEAYDKPAWHGPNLRGALRRVPVEQAVWRPRSGRHAIAEITVHAAYWKYAVRRRLRGDQRGSFPLKGSNWFPVPADLTRSTWRGYVDLLDAEHAALRAAIAALPRARLHKTSAGSKVSNATLIRGIALHDVYHAGQVRLLKRGYDAR